MKQLGFAFSLLGMLLVCGCASSSSHDRMISEIMREYMDEQVPEYGTAPEQTNAGVGEEGNAGAVESSRQSRPAAQAVPEAAPTAPAMAADKSVPTLPSSVDEEQIRRTVTIQPDTVLRVTVKEDPTLNGTYKVSQQGGIQFKYVGLLFLDNLTVQQAEQMLKERLEGAYMRQATVEVQILQASYDQIRVLGDVEKPGDQKIGAGGTISLHMALLRAGGVKIGARNARVRVVKDGMLSPIALSEGGMVYQLLDQNGRPHIPDVELDNNDLVNVYEYNPVTKTTRGAAGVGTRILLLGEVDRPGYVDFAPGEEPTMLNLIFKIGGFPRWAKASKVEVVRSMQGGQREIYVVNAESVQKTGDPEDDFVLRDGDIVRVPTKSFSF